jgi:DNA polymerase III epsilon subunit-like protein
MGLPPILVVDVETTSADPSTGGLVEIGAHWLTGPRAGEEFENRCVPRMEAMVDVEALEVNGCDWLESDDELTEAEAVESFLRWVGPEDCLLAGMNPYFDRWFLKSANEAARTGMKLPFPHRTLDMHTLMVTWAAAYDVDVPARGFYTDAILGLLGLPPEPRPHRAIAGARAEAAAFRVLLGMERGAL